MARGSVVSRFFLLFSSSHSRQSPAAVGRILLGHVFSAHACAVERSLSNTFSLVAFSISVFAAGRLARIASKNFLASSRAPGDLFSFTADSASVALTWT